ncbi:MAG TPA: hypothetical protein VJB59_09345 [Bdellovibrionota bacterium]|nr:hypothetical protein [Bdellovibrionota bacterium]
MKRCMWFLVSVFAIMVLPLGSAHADNCLQEGFLPRNEMLIPPDSVFVNGITEAKFDEILDRAVRFYAPVISNRGGVLELDRNWQDATVNAYAERNGRRWIIRMFGGLARHPAITEDGFALITCHEIGHHVGGAPKYRRSWAANEGQSDYFATLKCLRNLFSKDDNVGIVSRMKLDPVAVSSCENSFATPGDVALCERNAMAGLSVGKLAREMSGGTGPEVGFSTPDRNVVTEILDDHPAAQCRLDTYFGGVNCRVPVSHELSETDAAAGSCSEELEFESGFRPRCWYKPFSNSEPNPPQTGIARTPLLLGQTHLVLTNPYTAFPIQYDVSEFPAAFGVYVEVSQPNREFIVPNGTIPDPYRLFWFSRMGVRGDLIMTPIRDLPGWGTYSVRVIALDSSGMSSVGRFSNSAKLVLSPVR